MHVTVCIPTKLCPRIYINDVTGQKTSCSLMIHILNYHSLAVLTILCRKGKRFLTTPGPDKLSTPKH